MTVRTFRYSLPSVQGEGWAIAFLDSAGCFTVLSDWGNYGHRWPTSGLDGREFRKFLIECEDDYVLCKLSRRDDYDGDATLRAAKDAILQCRRHGSWSKAKARAEWDDLEDHGDLGRPEEFGTWLEHTAIEEAWEMAVYDYPSDVRAFIAKVMPRLRAAIREQLAQEAGSEVAQ